MQAAQVRVQIECMQAFNLAGCAHLLLQVFNGLLGGLCVIAAGSLLQRLNLRLHLGLDIRGYFVSQVLQLLLCLVDQAVRLCHKCA